MSDDNPRGPVDEPTRRPNLTGDLETMLAIGPVFRSRLRGYDRLQVDNYVRWAETELLGARCEVDDLAAHFGSCLAELAESRRRSAESPEARELDRVSERIGEMLRLAADEASEIRAGAHEAERAAAERLAAEEERARMERDAMLATAAAEVATMREELADLGHRRDQARACLDRLAAQIGEALQVLADSLPPEVRVGLNGRREHVVTGNLVAQDADPAAEMAASANGG